MQYDKSILILFCSNSTRGKKSDNAMTIYFDTFTGGNGKYWKYAVVEYLLKIRIFKECTVEHFEYPKFVEYFDFQNIPHKLFRIFWFSTSIQHSIFWKLTTSPCVKKYKFLQSYMYIVRCLFILGYVQSQHV